MSIQGRKHDVNKKDIAGLVIYLKTTYKMPAGMAVVAFTAFADVDGALDFQSYHALALCGFPDKVGIGLM